MVPRTPPYEAIYHQRTSSSSKEKEETPDESATGIESPQAKRARTPPKDSEEDIQRRLQEWKDAADADRKLAESWKPHEITEEGQRQAEEAFRRGEQWKKWFETNQEAMWRVEREKEEGQRHNDMKAKASEWRNSLLQGSGGEAQSSGGATSSSEEATTSINKKTCD